MKAKTDPVDQLLARGLSARDLIAYMLPGIVWLAEHQDETFRLCYHGSNGEVVVETVAGSALIARARGLGWTPGDLLDGRPACMFDEAVYHCRRGVHWYATACDDTTQMLPLGLPAKELAAAQRREERLYGAAAQARRKAADERRKRAAHRAEDRAVYARVKEVVEMVTGDLMKEARESGRPIAISTARRRAWKHVKETDDGTYFLLCKKLRAMQNNGVKVKV
ncbi:TPA: hypothetical protein UOJ01_002294 [Stenotrophomonas maltophilia]|nr:hypothetical protein [Stenotrophomonas maltophilia]HEL5316845.1 hypothetical protein [Stenotrophomonas maltophilia]HEL5343739.1 hypothetical protein [Stenotrophomonas maltophilia]